MQSTVNALIEQIVKHPAVSRAYANGPKIEALTDLESLQALCRLRRASRAAKQAIQNAREDVVVSGGTDSPARMPGDQRQARLIGLARDNAYQLPDDLAEMVVRAAQILAA